MDEMESNPRPEMPSGEKKLPENCGVARSTPPNLCVETSWVELVGVRTLTINKAYLISTDANRVFVLGSDDCS